LLAKLESNTRQAVAKAARITKKNASFGAGMVAAPAGGGTMIRGYFNLTEQQVNDVFTPLGKSVGDVDCLGMAAIEWCEGLIKQLNTGEFNAMDLHPGQFSNIFGDNYTIYQPGPLLAMQEGELITFSNPASYASVHPSGWAGCENTIEISPNINGPDSGAYAGWGGSSRAGSTDITTPLGWRTALKTSYNAGLSKGDQITLPEVPGYVPGKGGVFLNLAFLGMKIFDLRTASKVTAAGP
jgi:hypothetical protein